jgi:hypothetical protein
MGKDRLSVEVDMLLDKLLLFQEQVGGKEEEKKELDPAFKDDLFLSVKDTLTRTMMEVRLNTTTLDNDWNTCGLLTWDAP